MSEQTWRKVLLRGGMPLDEAAQHLSALHSAKETLTGEGQHLLGIAEGLLELVRLGAAVYMDSEAIEADLYGAAGPDTTGPAVERAGQKPSRPSVALRAVDRDALQVVFDRYLVVDVLASGPTASGADEPGNALDLLFSHPENFSGFIMMDLADDLEALLGVPVNLVSNHPVNRGWLMEHYRASAIPLEDLLDRLDQLAPVDPGTSPPVQPSGPREDPLDNAETQAGIDALDLPAEFTRRQSWWSEWDPERGTVSRFNLDPDTGDIEAFFAALRERHGDGHVIEVWTYPRAQS